jgi:hypothetical protein
MRAVREGEHGRARRHALLGQPVMYVIRREQTQAGVMVFGVVPGEKEVAVGPGVLDRAEPRRKRRTVLQRLELRF